MEREGRFERFRRRLPLGLELDSLPIKPRMPRLVKELARRRNIYVRKKNV